MARSRKKSSARPTSNAKATAPAESAADPVQELSDESAEATDVDTTDEASSEDVTAKGSEGSRATGPGKRAKRPADAQAETKDAGKADDKAADAKDAAPRKRSGKDPVKRSAPGKDAAGKNKAGKDKAAPKGGAVAEKAKDSTRSTSVKKAAAAESTRSTGRRVAAAGQTPSWLAPTAVVLLILGLLYLVTYYLSSGQLPLPIGDWNLAAGFGVLMVGGGMLMFWK